VSGSVGLGIALEYGGPAGSVTCVDQECRMPGVIVPLPTTVLVACAALLVTVVCLWLRPIWLWCVPLAVAFAAALVAGIMTGPAPVWLLFLALMLVTYRRSATFGVRVCIATVIAVDVLLLALHALPGFENPLVLRETVLSAGAIPYRQYVNFDKTLAGVLVLASGVPLLRSRDQWLAMLRGAAPVVLATLIAVLVASFALGYVRFDPRWTPAFWVWAPINLLATCVSEEAFFRAFLQREVGSALEGRPHAAAIAVAISATLFGLAHAAGGWRYVLLATLAGTGYAIAFQRTGRVEAAILTHVAVNATHFLLFTYPALASAI
jgi:membrane protease YdiL (CAAX protease family)